MEPHLRPPRTEPTQLSACRFMIVLLLRCVLRLARAIEHTAPKEGLLQPRRQTWLTLECVWRWKKVPRLLLLWQLGRILRGRQLMLIELQSLRQLLQVALSVLQLPWERKLLLFCRTSILKESYILFIEWHHQLWQNLVVDHTLCKFFIHIGEASQS